MPTGVDFGHREDDETDDRDGKRIRDCDGEALGSWRIHPGLVC